MNELEQIRRDKVEILRQLGADPFGRGRNTTSIADVRSLLDGGEKNLPPQNHYTVAARVVGGIRNMGKLKFLTIRDDTGSLQVMISAKILSEVSQKVSACIDSGDFICVEGALGISNSGEYQIIAGAVEVASKALVPPPEKFVGLQDIEQRYRNRHVDLSANPEAISVFQRRSQIIHSIRSFLHAAEYVEVETPLLHPIASGASATPFQTQYSPSFNKDEQWPLFLRIAPELYLKRLLMGGFTKIFEIGKNFRNEGLSPRHNPEFTVLELYAAFGDYESMMELVENMLTSVSMHVEQSIIRNSPTPWRRVKMRDLVISEKPEAVDWTPQNQHAYYELNIEPKLIEPTFVTHFPAFLVPLAKESLDEPGYAECFEFVVNGMEIAPGYTEQNNPDVQRRVFEEQAKANGAPVDEAFLNAMLTGMPPAGGIGIGIDRLVMLLTGEKSIKDVILFPMMR
jgi:lysyl-tRNA synthetase class 2